MLDKEQFREEAVEKLTEYLASENILRPRQEEVLQDVVDDLKAGNWSGSIKKPTGTGKSIMQGALSEALGVKTLILVPTKELVKQTKDKLTDEALLGIDPDSIVAYHSGEYNSKKQQQELIENAKDADTLITTYSSFVNLFKNGDIDYGDHSFVILDESHKAKGEQRFAIIENLSEEAYVQAWTATDLFRENGEVMSVGQKLFSRDDNIHTTSFTEATEHEEIAPARNVIFETDHAPNVMSKGDDYTTKEEMTIITQKGRDEAAVNKFAEFRDEESGIALRNEKSVWYTRGINNAENLADKLNEVFGDGYAAAINGEMSDKEQDKILKAHKAGEIRALVNSDLLIEGYDDPSISVSVMLRPTKSPDLVEQAGGRATRLDKDNPDKIAYVVSFVDQGQNEIVTFGEVVGGSDFIKDEQKKRVREEKEKNKDEDFEPSGRLTTAIEVKPIYKEREIIDFTKRREENQEALGIVPERPEGFLSANPMAKTLGIDPQKIRSVYTDLQNALEGEQTGQNTITISVEDNTLSLPAKDMGMFKASSSTVLHIDGKHTEAMGNALGNVTKSPKGFLTAKSMAERIGTDPQKIRPIYTDLRKALEGEQKGQDTITIPVGGTPLSLPAKDMGVFKAGSNKAFHVDDKHKEAMSNALGVVPKKPEGFVAAAQMAKALGTAPQKTPPIYANLREALEGKQKGQDTITIPVGDNTLSIPAKDMGMFKSGVQTVFYIASKHKKEIGNALGVAPEKPKGFAAAAQMAKELGVNITITPPVYADLRKALEGKQKGLDTITIPVGDNTLSIPAKDMGMFKARSQTVFYIDDKHKEAIGDALGIVPEKPGGFLATVPMAEVVGVSPQKIRPIYADLREALEGEQKGQDTITISVGDNALSLPAKGVGIYRAGSKEAFYVDEEHKETISNALGVVPKKPEGFVAAGQMAKELQVSDLKIKAIYADLRETLEEEQKGQDTITIPVGDNTLSLPAKDMGMFKKMSSTVFYVNGEHREVIGNALGVRTVPEKPEGFMAAQAMGKAIGISDLKIRPIYADLREALEGKQKGQDTITISVGDNALSLPTKDIGMFKSGTNKAFHVDSKHAPAIAETLGREISKEKLADLGIAPEKEQSTKWIDRVGKKKDISPDSEDLIRTGIQREKDRN